MADVVTSEAMNTHQSSIASGQPIVIGRWQISEDSYGNLVFNFAGGATIAFSPQGRVTSNGLPLIQDQDPIHVVLASDQNTALNRTMKGDGSHPNGFNGWTYWMSNPDGDSNLVIQKK